MKKTNAKKSSKKRSVPSRPATASRARNNVYQKSNNSQLFSILFLGMAILTIALVLIPGKNIWLFFRNLLFGLFSKGAYFLPGVCVYISYIYDANKQSEKAKSVLKKIIYLFLLICTLSQILFYVDMLDHKNIIDFVKVAFKSGVDKQGGGLVSALISWPLLYCLGFGGSVALVSVLIFVLLMVISKATLTDLFRVVCAPAKKIETLYSEKHNNKQNDKINNIKTSNIDIPLDDFPAHPVESNKNNFCYDLNFETSHKNQKNKNINKDIEKKQNKNDNVNFVELDEITQNSFDQKRNNLLQDRLIQNSFPSIEYIDTISDNNIHNNHNNNIHNFDNEKDGNFTSEIKNKKDSNSTTTKITQNQTEDGTIATNEHDRSVMTKDASEMADDIQSVISSKIKLQSEQGDQLKAKTDEFSKILTEPKDDRRLNFLSDSSDSYVFPGVDLLKSSVSNDNNLDSQELMNTAQKLVETLKSFGVSTKLLDFSKGPSVTRYELKPAAGVKISKITGLADDIALNLASAGVRIEAPIPNKSAVGIEVPNKTVNVVGIKEIIDSDKFKNSQNNLSVALGKDISGNITIADLAKKPHLLIAGSTGSGKSVCINSIIISLIYKSSPENVRLLLIDPKVVELGVYNDIPHLLIPVVTDPKKAAGALNWAVGEMLKRYKMFADLSVRDLNGYNRLAKRREDLNPLPQIVIIIDELADLMMVAPNEIEDSICRLAQMARAAGMHLVIATQRPSVDVITGIIKANIPSRIAFAVSSQVDSRTIIDSAGAEKLLGRGDMLFFPMGYSKPVRVQGCFVSDREVENVVSFIKQSHNSDYDEEISQEIERLSVLEKSKGAGSSSSSGQEDDEMLPSAIECAVENGEISTSFLQRKLKLGYSRAARLIDEMEERGIIGAKEGSKPRQTLISRQQWIEMNLNNPDLDKYDSKSE